MNNIFAVDDALFERDNFDLDNDDNGDNNGDDTVQESTGRWTREEHLAFVRGLELHGKGWKKIAALIKTRTVVQIRTHAQKYFLKLSKTRQSGDSNGISIDGKPLGPNRKKSKRRNDRPVALAQPILSFVKKPTAPGETLDIDDGLYNFLSPRLAPISGSSSNFYHDSMLTGGLTDSKCPTPLPLHPGDHELLDQSGTNMLPSSSAHSLDTMFYVDSSKPEWFQRGHNVDQLLKDAEGLNWLQDCGSLLPLDNILPIDKKNRSASTFTDGIAFQHPNNAISSSDKAQGMIPASSRGIAGGHSNSKSLTNEYALTAANLTSLNSSCGGSNDFNMHIDASDIHMLHHHLHSESKIHFSNTPGMRFETDNLTSNDFAWASLGLEQFMATSTDPSTSNGQTTASNSTSACLSSHSSSLNIAALDCKDLDGYDDDKSSDYNHESTSSDASSRKYITKLHLTTLNAHNSTIKLPLEGNAPDAHGKNHDDKSVSDVSGCTTIEEVVSPSSSRKRKTTANSFMSKSSETSPGRRSSRINVQ